jgi:hypothetical protein
MMIVGAIAGILLGIVGFLIYPYFAQMLDALYDIAVTLLPGITALDTAFFRIAPLALLLFLIWLVIMLVLGKINIFGGGSEGGE